MGGFKVAFRQTEWNTQHGYAYRSRLGDDMWEGVLRFDNFQALLGQHKMDFPSTTEAEIDDRSSLVTRRGDCYT